MCQSPGFRHSWFPYFMCGVGHPVLDKRLLCDGTKDCPDESDEIAARCGGEAECLSLTLSLSVCLSVCLSLCLCLSVFLSVCLLVILRKAI